MISDKILYIITFTMFWGLFIGSIAIVLMTIYSHLYEMVVSL